MGALIESLVDAPLVVGEQDGAELGEAFGGSSSNESMIARSSRVSASSFTSSATARSSRSASTSAPSSRTSPASSSTASAGTVGRQASRRRAYVVFAPPAGGAWRRLSKN